MLLYAARVAIFHFFTPSTGPQEVKSWGGALMQLGCNTQAHNMHTHEAKCVTAIMRPMSGSVGKMDRQEKEILSLTRCSWINFIQISISLLLKLSRIDCHRVNTCSILQAKNSLPQHEGEAQAMILGCLEKGVTNHTMSPFSSRKCCRRCRER